MFAHAAVTHAEVLALHDNRDTLGLQMLLDCIGHLGGQLFLDLQAPGEYVDHPGQLGQAHDAAIGSMRTVANVVSCKEALTG